MVMDNIEHNATRISLAAEELIKATYQQTETAGIVVQREVAKNIATLQKESVDLKIDVNEKLNCVNANLQELQKQNQKILEVHQKSTTSMLQAITTLNKSIGTLNVTMKEEGRNSRLLTGLRCERTTLFPTTFDAPAILHAFSKGGGLCFRRFGQFEDEDIRKEVCYYLSVLTGTPTTFEKDKDDDGDECWVLSQNPRADENITNNAATTTTTTTAAAAKINDMKKLLMEVGLDKKEINLIVSPNNKGYSRLKAMEIPQIHDFSDKYDATEQAGWMGRTFPPHRYSVDCHDDSPNRWSIVKTKVRVVVYKDDDDDYDSDCT